MTKIIKLNLLCLISFFFLISSKQAAAMVQDTSAIVARTVKLTGKIISPNNINKEGVFVNFYVPHPISGENVQYRTFVDLSGNFSIDVEVESNITLIGIYTSINSDNIFIKLTNTPVTNITITYDKGDEIENIGVKPAGLTFYDMARGIEAMGRMIEYSPDREPEFFYDKSADDFLEHAKTSLSERLQILDNDSLMSKELKDMLANDFRLILYKEYVFPYERNMLISYKFQNNGKIENNTIQKIDRNYFRFLKDFNLNDQKYLYGPSFSDFQKEILRNEILALPVIGETDIPSWLKDVKVILSDLVGFSEGPYYDVLVANAYARQLNEQAKPLSEKQKENIANYWKNGEIAKILFRKNKGVVEIDRLKSPTVINDISSVADEKVMETILSKYKGKVVLIDFWATWCGPCLDAMQQFKSIKGDFDGKNIAFVYLTNSSSAKKLWEEKIIGIGSEHYYLKDSQWEYIMNEFGFSGIPSYVVYDKDGLLINKFTGFPGNEKVKEMINKLL